MGFHTECLYYSCSSMVGRFLVYVKKDIYYGNAQMAKYYVTSGELKRIVSASDALDACEKALIQASGETIGEYFYVDERGFRDQANSTPIDMFSKFAILPKYVFNTAGADTETNDLIFDENEDWLDDPDFDT